MIESIRCISFSASLAFAVILSGCGEPSAPVPVLYPLPNFTLTDQAGAVVSIDSFHGNVWVADFIFTRCGATCPAQTMQKVALASDLKNIAGGDRVKLVSFTVDPEHDTPEVLADYAKRHSADPKVWEFLTGSREELWTLSKGGFKLPVEPAAKTDPVLIYHSPRFVLVDGGGRVRGYYDGLDPEGIAKLKTDMSAVLKEPVPESIVRPSLNGLGTTIP